MEHFCEIILNLDQWFACLFCCFTSQTAAMVMMGKLEQPVTQYYMHILSLITDNNPS